MATTPIQVSVTLTGAHLHGTLTGAGLATVAFDVDNIALLPGLIAPLLAVVKPFLPAPGATH